MKNLNEYIKESILDDEEDLVNDDSALIEQFLKENYNLRNCTYTIHDNIVDVDGLIRVKRNKLNELTKLTNGLFEFGTVGVFSCESCEKLESLEGGPKIVKGQFDCSITNIENLIGAPKEVGEQFLCEDCMNLKSLEGAPEKVNYFNCSGSTIKDLTGITQQIGDSLDCSFCEKLESLKGSPKKLSGCLILIGCDKLKSLKYCPKEIGGFLRYPKSFEDEDVKEEIKKNNIKVKKLISDDGRFMHFK